MAYMKYLEPSLQFITQFWRVTTTETTEETIIIGKCEVCQAETSRQCSSCKSTFYCSEEHQKQDWENHKIICNITPFEIVEVSEGKKYLKAPKDLEPGEVILMETPVVFGPKTLRISEGSFPCVGCCRLISTTDCSKCPECSWPICSLECAGLKDERLHGMECKVLRLRPPQLEVSFYDYYRFDILIALRTLFLQKLEINQWKEVMSLQSHMEKRGSETDVYKIVQEKAQFVEDNYLGLLRAYEHEIGEEILPAVPSDLIHKIYGIIHANSVEINIEEVSAQAIYSTSNYIEHNCIPCTSDQVDVQNQFQITFRATLPVKKEEHITSSYTDILLGTHARRLDLRQRKYIQSCSCDRCKDPTEMGSFVSALKCIGSETDPCGGMQLPLDPINEETDWKCDKCGILLPNNEIMKFVEHLGKEVEKVMVKDATTLEEMEETLEKLMNFLNPNHYLVYRMKFSMIKMYDRVEVTEEVLQKKLKMCENLIDITKRIDPGNSKLTVYLSDLLNEHFKTKKLMLQRSFSMEKKEAVCSNINELLAILEGNKHILQYNSSDSKQSKIYLEVCENESQFKNWLSENNIIIEYQ